MYKDGGYIGTKVLFERLWPFLGVTTNLEFSKVIAQPTSTTSTWKARNKIPYELMIRIHLATDLDVGIICYTEEMMPLECIDFSKLKNPLSDPVNLLTGERMIAEFLARLGCSDVSALANKTKISIDTWSIFTTSALPLI